MKNNVFAVLSVLTLLASPALAESVCSVHDGDTFRLCSGQSIRIAGIDAPELRQPMGEASRDYLARLVMGRDVILNCVGRSYHRKVCRVSVGGMDVAREMVGQGWAFDYTHYSHGAFQGAEGLARLEGRGVWVVPGGGIKPWDFRRR